MGEHRSARGAGNSSRREPLSAEAVYALVRLIPPGRVSTYGRVARALGRPGAARAVGRLLRRNPRPGIVPCHRVVRANGRLGGYFGGGVRGESRKMLVLAREGLRPAGGGDCLRLKLTRETIFDDFRNKKSRGNEPVAGEKS